MRNWGPERGGYHQPKGLSLWRRASKTVSLSLQTFCKVHKNSNQIVKFRLCKILKSYRGLCPWGICPRGYKEPDATEQLNNNSMELRLLQGENPEEELSGWRGLSCGFYKARLAPWPMAADFSFFAKLSIYWAPFSMPGDAGPSGCSCEQERHGFHPQEVYNQVQFLKIKFSWPSISTLTVYLLHHKIYILDCGLGWLWQGGLYDHKH